MMEVLDFSNQLLVSHWPHHDEDFLYAICKTVVEKT